jgi:hypothetical protein
MADSGKKSLQQVIPVCNTGISKQLSGIDAEGCRNFSRVHKIFLHESTIIIRWHFSHRPQHCQRITPTLRSDQPMPVTFSYQEAPFRLLKKRFIQHRYADFALHDSLRNGPKR